MECIICLETKWVTMTECDHPICISCLFELRKDECPYCRREIFNGRARRHELGDGRRIRSDSYDEPCRSGA